MAIRSVEQELLAAFQAYLAAYASRSLPDLLAGFAPEMTGFGTGPDEISLTGPDGHNMYVRELEQIPEALIITLKKSFAQALDAGAGLVMAEFDLGVRVGEDTLTFEGIRATHVFRKIGRRWRMAHVHVSLPFTLQAVGESVPIKELQERNRVLEEKIAERTRELQETNRQLAELAARDPLTGLYNRREFFSLAGQDLLRAARYRRPCCLAMFDMDNFSRINNTFGHQTGDALLCEIASVCRAALRSSDIFARYGGDEFIILMPETTLEEGMETAGRLCRVVDEVEMSAPDGSPVKVTISMGLACHTGPGQTIDQLIERADLALYEAKNTGRSRVVGSPCAAGPEDVQK